MEIQQFEFSDATMPPLLARMQKDLLKIILLAVLYYITGKVGLYLAVPPGYATIIWPPSGIALGMLLVYGRHLWPGIFIGSLILNLQIAAPHPLAEMWQFTHLLVPTIIALGSSLQAVVGSLMIERFCGSPLAFTSIKNIAKFSLVAGPLTCLIAASFGTGVLFMTGEMKFSALIQHWLTWWGGDIFGVLVFLPIMMIAPFGRHVTSWRGEKLGKLSLSTLIILLTPLGLTFYAWKISSENVYTQAASKFESLVIENEKTIQNRLESYKNALVSAAAFYQSSNEVTLNEWQEYVRVINIKQNFPGMRGMGWIERLTPAQLPTYIQTMQHYYKDFMIHPLTTNHKLYVITYIEPKPINVAAVGLNIAFEPIRTEAADTAANTGLTTITRHIILVQDETRTPGFLILQAVYKSNAAINTRSARQQALLGWVYAPIQAEEVLGDLASYQDKFSIAIYDGNQAEDKKLIYASDKSEVQNDSKFLISKTIHVMQKEWLVVWKSNKAFEKSEDSLTPIFVLTGGILFTVILGLFLLVNSGHAQETIEELAGERNFLVPIVIIIGSIIGSLILYFVLLEKENYYVRLNTKEDLKKLMLILSVQNQENILALKRMAQRWEIANGTPYELWKNDANNYINQMPGLTSIAWVDARDQIRWIIPQQGNEALIGANIIENSVMHQSLEQTMKSHLSYITKPMHDKEGRRFFSIYMPLANSGPNSGILAAQFSIDQLLSQLVQKIVFENYYLTVSYDNESIYHNQIRDHKLAYQFSANDVYRFYDKPWQFILTPTLANVENQISSLPTILLFTGILIGVLAALNIHFMLLTKLKSRNLKLSEETFRSAMENAPIGKALVRPDGSIIKTNRALCELLGYEDQQLLQMNFADLTYPDDIAPDREFMLQLINHERQSYQMEKRFFHKDGNIIYTLLTVSLVRRSNDDAPNYFVSQIQDITKQKEIERMKDEFISTVSHELRTPLTSIRGSLGLVLGTMSQHFNEKMLHLIDIAYKNCERLILLINDMLDIDKIASGRMRFDMQEECLSKLVDQAIEANQAFIEKFQARIHLTPIDDKIKINVDPSRFIQVLTNLISNAAKFTRPQDVIEIYARIAEHRVALFIKDHGPGIPKDFQNLIFNKFAQADAAANRKKGGTGLGLHISKQIIEHMHGNIGFSSEEGQGATFWIELPVASNYQRNVNLENTTTVNASKLPVILHVEDDIDLSQMLGASLHNQAHVVTATTINEAHHLLSSSRFDLIIIDIAMPDGDGYQLIETLGQSNGIKSPILILSASEVKEEVRNKIAGALVKSQVSETKIVSKILEIITNDKRN